MVKRDLVLCEGEDCQLELVVDSVEIVITGNSLNVHMRIMSLAGKEIVFPCITKIRKRKSNEKERVAELDTGWCMSISDDVSDVVMLI